MANYLNITNKFLKSPFGIKLGNRFHVTGEKFIGNSTIKLNLSKKLSDGRFIDQTIFDYGNKRVASMTRKSNKNGSNFLSIVYKKDNKVVEKYILNGDSFEYFHKKPIIDKNNNKVFQYIQDFKNAEGKGFRKINGQQWASAPPNLSVDLATNRAIEQFRALG